MHRIKWRTGFAAAEGKSSPARARRALCTARPLRYVWLAPVEVFKMHRLFPTTPGTEPETVTCDVDVLNSLLRGEVAAGHTYDMVIAKFNGQPQAIQLQRICDEHTETAAVLRERVRHFGGDPAEGPGLWGKLAAAITGTAKILGPTMALGTLKRGEEYGIGQYEKTLCVPDVDGDDKDLIRYRLLPRCQQHVTDLDRMIDAIQKE